MTFFKLVFVLYISLILNSCAYFEEDETKLPGKRENVFKLEEKTIIKAKEKIVLVEPKFVDSWPQQHQNTRNHLFHFQSKKKIKFSSKISLGEISFDKFQHTVSPLISKETIYYIDNNFNVLSKSLKTGKVNWKIGLKREKKEKLGFAGGLAMTNNELVITTGLGNVYSLRIKDGKIRWSKDLLVQFSRPPTIHKKKIFVVSDDNQLFVLDLDLGDEIWSHMGNLEEVSIIGGSKPVIDENVVVVTYSSGEVYALNINDGGLLWFDNINSGNFFNRNIVSDIQSPSTIFDGKVFVPTFSDKFNVYDVRDGKKIWSLNFSSINPFAISGNIIYVLDITGRLLCLEKSNGNLLWAVQLRLIKNDEEIIWYGPLLSSHKIILASSQGTLLSLSPYTGRIISSINFNESFAMSPMQVGEKIFLISKEGSVFIFE